MESMLVEIRGDRLVIDTTGKKFVSSSVNYFALFNSCIYFEQFTSLEFDLYLAILGCKPKLEIVVA